MKQVLSKLLQRMPGGMWLIRMNRVCHAYWQMLGFYLRRRGMTRQQIFAQHYETNWWQHPETRSGHGASLAYTENIRREIPRLISELGIGRVLDAPCGDFHWFQHIVLPERVHYTGADIVPALIEENRRKYGNDRTAFVELDIVKDALPAADLWLCRAALFHFSNRDICATLANFLRSDIRYLLTTTLPQTRDNKDIMTGSYRPLNLERPPYGLPPPLVSIDDWIPGCEVMTLCLWQRDTIQRCLEANTAFQRFLRSAAREPDTGARRSWSFGRTPAGGGA